MTVKTLVAEIVSRLWEQEIFGNSVLRWLIAAGVFAFVLIVLRGLQSFLRYRAKLVGERTGLTVWELVRSLTAATTIWFLLATSLYAGSLLLTLPPKLQSTLRVGEVTMLLLQTALWGNVALQFAMQQWAHRRLKQDPSSASYTAVIGYAARLILWSFILLLILENLGIQVTALLAGLGIGGVAVALAMQTILGDLFASMSILVDKPFVIGDFIIVGDLMGTVENIGLKTTRLRSLWGELLIFPNGDLLKSRIQNFKQMNERRVLFKIGVRYETPPDKLAALPGLIRKIIESQHSVRFDRAHFQGFSDSSLDFEIVYFVRSSDYNVYMDIQQAINLELVRLCAAEEIDFAHPTQIQYLPRGEDQNSTGPSKSSS